jgi:hypothetical protein
MKTRALGLTLALASLPTRAFAWESVCYQYPDTTLEPAAYATLSGPYCSPSAGPNTARHRWIGNLDEHRRIFETTRERAGLPDSVSANVTLRVFASSAMVASGSALVPSIRPVAFDRAERVATRVVSVGELAQLPDFSYSLWDWAMGHETCPLDGIGATPESCHGFATHMGPVNANHFVPISGSFYAHYHALALARAHECAAMSAELGSAATRFAPYLQECESEAIALEAIGQHYLQDAWSSGHMWQRWGSPDLADFPGATVEERRSRAVLVALVAGFVHGSRGVLQVLPAWTSFDVNDALCAPNDAVEFVRAGSRSHAIGDDFLQLLPRNGGTDATYEVQSNQLYSCATSGLLEVYRAAGQQHGVLGPRESSLATVDPTSAACFGQRVTNRAFVTGAAIQLRIAGAQIDLPVDSRVASMLVPNLARAAGEATITPALRNRFRMDLVRAMSLARVIAKDAPEGTEIAEGALGDLLGAHPNGAYASRPTLAPYIDPALPWPGTNDATPSAAERAQAIAGVFHRGHVGVWCRATTDAQLTAMRSRASDTTLDATTHAAACDACGEIAQRHLRVGASASAYDTSDEPVCHYLAPTAPVVYQPASAGSDRAALARAWCGCR